MMSLDNAMGKVRGNWRVWRHSMLISQIPKVDIHKLPWAMSCRICPVLLSIVLFLCGKSPSMLTGTIYSIEKVIYIQPFGLAGLNASSEEPPKGSPGVILAKWTSKLPSLKTDPQMGLSRKSRSDENARTTASTAIRRWTCDVIFWRSLPTSNVPQHALHVCIVAATKGLGSI